jgi:hypothetical protein
MLDRMNTQQSTSFATLSLIAERSTQFSFPNLPRPPVAAHEPATAELVNWGTRVYCFSWMRHFCMLLNGIVLLKEAGNTPSARIVARSVFELGAHAYYVKKHLKQHTDAGNFSAAWKFLTPIATGSRYINEQHPEESEMFPASAHISKAINCFGERMPEDAQEGYSFLSEFCHPNVLAFSQYYDWANPQTVTFVDDHEPLAGIFGPTAAASIEGLLAMDELLKLAQEREVLRSLHELLEAIVECARKASGASA